MKKIHKLLEETQFIRSTVGYLVKDGKVLLGLRKKVSHGLGENLISGIGGKLEEGEDDDTAFLRELKEEINVTATKIIPKGRIKFIFPDKPKWSHSVALYIVREWIGEPRESEEIKPLWFDQHTLPHDQMWEDSKLWMSVVLKNKSIDAVVLYGTDGKVEDYIIKEIHNESD